MNTSTFISAIIVALASFAAAAPIADGETGSGTPVSFVSDLDGHLPHCHWILNQRKICPTQSEEPFCANLPPGLRWRLRCQLNQHPKWFTEDQCIN